MSDDFDDDDVFDNVDVNTILQSSQPLDKAKEQTHGQQPERQPGADSQLEDSLFDDVDTDELIRSSQPTKNSQTAQIKRSSLDSDHPSSRKRKKIDHEPTFWDNTEQDKDNLKLARRLLADKFGYRSFRHEQEGAIRRILAGENTLVIFPTGAGKSLCYQVSLVQSLQTVDLV